MEYRVLSMEYRVFDSEVFLEEQSSSRASLGFALLAFFSKYSILNTKY